MCAECCHRWFGNHAHQTFAQWHCRIDKKIKVIGKHGSDDDLKKAKDCKEKNAKL